MTSHTRNAALAIGAGTAWLLLGAAQARARRKRFADQVVLITGGSRGFGLALACEFAKLQCRIAICVRDQDEVMRAQLILKRAGREVFTVACDISDRNGVTAMLDAVTRHYGHIDILVNNAGEITVSPFENLQADFEHAMAVMFWGTVYATFSQCCRR